MLHCAQNHYDMKDIIQQLDASIKEYELLNHPFYQAWNDGTLPAQSLELYAWEYRRFIGKIAEGWDACGFPQIAEVERSHYDMWVDFAKSIRPEAISTEVGEISTLVSVCDDANHSEAAALGSLYAFECQQPYTATSKLKGLRDHYKSLGADETYFEVHVDDFDEPAMLRERIEALPEAGQAVALEACRSTSKALWDALTGIHEFQLN